jgi:hypothetical protein
VAEPRARRFHLLDGQTVPALAGDTVLTAILQQRAVLRHNEFSGQPRAGFCLMGACQDCWLHRRAPPARLHHPGQPRPSVLTGPEESPL